jgi:hypothetical protein
MAVGFCVFKHNDINGKPASAPFVYTDAAGSVKEVCAVHFTDFMKAEETAIRNQKLIEALEKARKERREKLNQSDP